MSDLSNAAFSLSRIRSLLRHDQPAEEQVEPPTVDPVKAPAGWGDPSDILVVAQRQYASAAATAKSLSDSLSHVVDDWRSLLVRPKAIDAMFMAAHACLLRVREELATGGAVMTTTQDLINRYFASVTAQDIAIREFLAWSIREAVTVGEAEPDNDIHRIVANLAAADLIDLLEPNPVTPPETAV